jgi:hypothetical protein
MVSDVSVRQTWPLPEVSRLLLKRPDDLFQLDGNGSHVFQTDAVDEAFLQNIRQFLRYRTFVGVGRYRDSVNVFTPKN